LGWRPDDIQIENDTLTGVNGASLKGCVEVSVDEIEGCGDRDQVFSSLRCRLLNFNWISVDDTPVGLFGRKPHLPAHREAAAYGTFLPWS
jgi:hypothetical protein